MRSPVGREAVLRLWVDDESGTLTAATGTPVLTVKDSTGAVVTTGTVSVESTGVYKATVPAPTAVDDLSVTWTYTVATQARTYTDTLKIIGGPRLVEPHRLKADSEMSAGLTAPSATLLADTVEEWFGSALGFPTSEERFTFERILRHSQQVLPLGSYPFPTSIDSAIFNGVALTASELAGLLYYGGTLTRDPTVMWDFTTGRWWPETGFAAGRWNVIGTHGPRYDWSNIPEDLRRAALTLARYCYRGSNYPERARQVQTEAALITFSTPTNDRPTGLPDVDGVVARYRLPAVV